jgi:hypothetical protein
MKKLIDEFMRLWNELSEENQKAVIDYARQLLINQHIKQNRGAE